MYKSMLTIAVLFSSFAQAGNLNVSGAGNESIITNAKITQVYQVQAGTPIEISIISSSANASCSVFMDTQTEANSLIAAINSGATISCNKSNRSPIDPSTFFAKSYSLSSFLGNK